MKSLTIEEKIGKVFEELVENEAGVAFVFSYVYTITNGEVKKEGEEIEGRSGAYGSKEMIDILVEELNGVIEENTDESDFVNA